MDPDLNKYDLEHAVTAHPRMSKAEWETLYADAWRIYYTDEHIATILRRARVYGINIWRLAQIILWFASSTDVERVHPLQGGILRLKSRHERRPELPVEPVWRFYPGLAWDFLARHLRLGRHAWRVYRIYRKVAKDPNGADYMDQAMSPVADDDTEHLEMFQTDAARAAVGHVRKVKALTGAA
jgi:hypothetical protein